MRMLLVPYQEKVFNYNEYWCKEMPVEHNKNSSPFKNNLFSLTDFFNVW